PGTLQTCRHIGFGPLTALGGHVMKSLAPCLLLPLLALPPAAPPAPAERPEDERLTSFFQSYLDEAFRLRPLEATRLGDHRFDHLLDDVSARARAAWAEHYRTTRAELPKKVDYRKLSRSAQIDYEIFEHDLTRSLWLAENTR